MKRFWRIVIGTGMVAFGIAGLYSAYNNGVILPDDELNMKNPSSAPFFMKQKKDEKEKGDIKSETEKSTGSQEDKTLIENKKISDYTDEEKKADQKLFKEIVSAKEVERCEEIMNTVIQASCRDSIHLSLALRDTTLSLCDSIESEEKKGYCRDQILLTQAEENNDYTHCADIINETLRSRCQEDEARKKIMEVTSLSDCDNIASKNDRELCIDFYIAQKAAAEDKEKGQMTCDEISNPDLRKQCKLKNAVQAAEQENDINPCKNLADQELQTTCLNKVKQELDQNQTETFIEEGDIGGCKSIKDADARQYCLDNALMLEAVDKHDPKMCRDIVLDSKRTKCSQDAESAENLFLFQTAKEKKDSKWCDLISDQEAQKSCTAVVSKLK